MKSIYSQRMRHVLAIWVWGLVAVFGLMNASGGEAPLRKWPAEKSILKNLIVEIPTARKKDAKTPLEFRFAFFILDSQAVEGRDCWRIAFIPGDKTPAESKKRFEIHVDKEFGWPRKLTAVGATSEAKIQKVADAWFIADATENIPFDFLPLVNAKEFQEGSFTLKFRTEPIGEEFVLDFTLLIDGQEKLRVRQRWKEGEPWWRYYDKHVDGKLVLRARVANAPAQADAFATNGKPAAKVTYDFTLRQDQRLFALVQVEPKQPSVAHVIGRIKEATQIDIEMSPELADHAPDLGYISPNPKGYFSWQLMELLAMKDIENGRWERTKSGYRLTGVSKSPRAPVPVVVRDGPANPPAAKAPIPPDEVHPPTAGGFRLWLVAAGISLIVFLAGLVAVLAFRLWSVTRPPNVPDGSAKPHPKSGGK